MTLRILLLLAIGAFAWPADSRAADANCANPQTQTDMSICAHQSFQKTDAELNQVYRTLAARLQGEADTRKALMAAQKAWLSFRDAECDFRTADSVGGTIHPMMVTQCLDELTKDRTAALKRYLNCPEGDLSCPIPGK